MSFDWAAVWAALPDLLQGLRLTLLIALAPAALLLSRRHEVHAVEDAPSSHQFKPFRLAPHAHGAPTREDGSRAPARRHPVASQVALSVSSSATVTSRTVAVAPAAVSAAWTCAAMTPATSSHVGMRRPGWNSGASLSEVP